MAEIERRRRRLRPSAGNPPPETPLPETPLPETPLPETPLPETPLPQTPPPPPVATTAAPEVKTRSADESERGLRGLVGSGSSQVSVTAAMRARDAARPTDEQAAEAENLTIVRRNWTPREELPRNR
jgi:hypothetical protein